jgi:hypothetical protein
MFFPERAGKIERGNSKFQKNLIRQYGGSVYGAFYEKGPAFSGNKGVP